MAGRACCLCVSAVSFFAVPVTDPTLSCFLPCRCDDCYGLMHYDAQVCSPVGVQLAPFGWLGRRTWLPPSCPDDACT